MNQTGLPLQQYGGWNKRYQHRSDTLGCDMKFSVFTPPASESTKVPVSNTSIAVLAQYSCAGRMDSIVTELTQVAGLGALLSKWVDL